MTLSELKAFWQLIQDAPDVVRFFSGSLIWTLILLILLGSILKLLFSKEFKELYVVIGTGTRLAGKYGRILIADTAKSLELPQPYPRAERFIDIVFMANGYASAFVYVSLALALLVLMMLAEPSGVSGRLWAVLLFAVFIFFARFFFASAERDRLRLYGAKNAYREKKST